MESAVTLPHRLHFEYMCNFVFVWLFSLFIRLFSIPVLAFVSVLLLPMAGGYVFSLSFLHLFCVFFFTLSSLFLLLTFFPSHTESTIWLSG